MILVQLTNYHYMTTKEVTDIDPYIRKYGAYWIGDSEDGHGVFQFDQTWAAEKFIEEVKNTDFDFDYNVEAISLK